MKRNRCYFLIITWTLIAALSVPSAWPQDLAFEPVSPDEIAAQRKAIETSLLAPPEKESLLALCDQAESYVREADTCRVKLDEYAQKIATLPSRIASTESELQTLSTEPSPIAFGAISLDEAIKSASEATDEATLAAEEKAAFNAESVRRVARRNEIPNSNKALQLELATVTGRLQAPRDQAMLSESASVRLLADRALYQSLQARILCNERELEYYERTGDFVPLQLRYLTRRLEVAETRREEWRQAVTSLKQQEARQETEQALLDEKRADTVFKSQAEENRRLAETIEGLVGKIASAESDATRWNKELGEVTVEFASMQERVRAVGLTDAIGTLMRTRINELPALAEHRSNIRDREQEIRGVQFTLFKLEDDRRQLLDLEASARTKARELAEGTADTPYQELEEATYGLLQRRAELLDTAIRQYEDYLTALVNVDQAERQLVEETELYEEYLDQRVLWIPSCTVLSGGELREMMDALTSAGAPKGASQWMEPAKAIAVDVIVNPILNVLLLILLAIWAFSLRPLRKHIRALGEYAEKPVTRNIGPTWAALALTILKDSFIPAILFAIAWRLANSPESTVFVLAVSKSLKWLAWWLLLLLVFTGICRRHGLGESHFAWPENSLLIVRRRLKWLLAVGSPLLFIVVLLETQNLELWSGSLGRICFLGLCSLLIATNGSLLHPESKFIRGLAASNPDNLLVRMRPIVFVGVTLILVSLMLLAILGYYYSSYRLAMTIGESAILLAVIVLCRAIFSRWVMLVRRRRAMDMLGTSEAASTEPTPPADIAGIQPFESTGPDLSAISSQTRRIVNSVLVVAVFVGLGVIWQELFPAFNQLDTIPIWPQTAADAVGSQADGASPDGQLSGNFLTKVSVADVIWAVAITAMTIIASSNVPGLLQIAMPPRLPLDSGARYAICTLSRYTVVVVGVILLSSAVGLQWEHVQWLVAAVGVGLGFGLQEIFANFVSGLILLFERPIRVGDTVTIGDISGVVTRIQIRATTITNWDRKDYIVPNKEFVTGRLLNWTRSDPVNRLVLEVSVAYGTDMDRVRHILREILSEHEEVLESPSPIVTFEAFGDSGLLVVIRCFLEKIDHRLKVRHELNAAIHRRLSEEGIAIPFPQRDVHIRSTQDDQTATPDLG